MYELLSHTVKVEGDQRLSGPKNNKKLPCKHYSKSFDAIWFVWGIDWYFEPWNFNLEWHFKGVISFFKKCLIYLDCKTLFLVSEHYDILNITFKTKLQKCPVNNFCSFVMSQLHRDEFNNVQLLIRAAHCSCLNTEVYFWSFHWSYQFKGTFQFSMQIVLWICHNVVAA